MPVLSICIFWLLCRPPVKFGGEIIVLVTSSEVSRCPEMGLEEMIL